MIHRSNSFTTETANGAITPAAGDVTAYAPGGIVAQSSSGQTITLHPGHGFVGGEKFMRGIDASTYSGVRTVQNVAGNVLLLDFDYSVDAGDRLVNLGTDGSNTSPPTYSGSSIETFADPGGVVEHTDARVTLDEGGNYEYWHDGSANIWELVRDGAGNPVGLVIDAYTRLAEPVHFGTRLAHLFATSGTGTAADPWVTAGSNPVQAALDDISTITGGHVHMVAGYYDLGDAANAVDIPVLTSGLDRKQYVFTGDGRELVFLNYRGTGNAFRYNQVDVGIAAGGPSVPGSSWQSNSLVFRGFAVCQAGTDFTGTAFLMTYVNSSTFEDLTIGTPRVEGGAGAAVPEPGYPFEYGLRFEGFVPGSNVVDFNRIDNCALYGNTFGIFMQNQGDNTCITRCDIQPDAGNTTPGQYGIRIHNSNAFVIQANHLNYYGRTPVTTGNVAIKLTGFVRGASVIGNYFERNPISVYVETTGNDGVAGTPAATGVLLAGNMVSFNQATNSEGFRIGINGGTFGAAGVNILSNSFYLLSATNTAIRINNDVIDFNILSNGYEDIGGTKRNIQIGARGFIRDIAETSDHPIIQLIDTEQFAGRLILENTSSSTEESPRIQFFPGGPTDVDLSIGANAAGALQLVDKDGSGFYLIQQSGGDDPLQHSPRPGDASQYPMGFNNTTIAKRGACMEEITLSTSGLTTDSTDNLLPANSIIEAVCAYVTETITVTTNWAVGDPTTSARFSSANSTLTAGTSSVGLNHRKGNVTTEATGSTQTSADKVRITCTGSNPGAGKIRIVVYYTQFVAPSA